MLLELEEAIDLLQEFNGVSVTVRVLLAAVLGGLVGSERGRRGRAAGMRTHVLVCLGSTLIMMTGEYIYHTFNSGGDIARLGAQVVSGVGFLGVGTIIVTGRNQVKGLTTAAGLWTCAGIGISIGIGFYSGAVIATVLVLILYRFLGGVDGLAYKHARILDLYIEFESRRAVTVFVEELKKLNYKILQLELNKPKKKNGKEENLITEITEVTEQKFQQEALANTPTKEEINGLQITVSPIKGDTNLIGNGTIDSPFKVVN